MIGVADRLTALTVEHILASSKEIEYVSGDTTVSGNTIADQITSIKNSTVYLSEDDYQKLVDNDVVEANVEYNIVEDE